MCENAPFVVLTLHKFLNYTYLVHEQGHPHSPLVNMVWLLNGPLSQCEHSYVSPHASWAKTCFIALVKVRIDYWPIQHSCQTTRGHMGFSLLRIPLFEHRVLFSFGTIVSPILWRQVFLASFHNLVKNKMKKEYIVHILYFIYLTLLNFHWKNCLMLNNSCTIGVK
jgi:hypothetical protein